MRIKTYKTHIFKEGENLISFIEKYIKTIKENDVIVITSKIVALSEYRVIHKWNTKLKEQLIKEESTYAVKTKYTWLTIKDNIVMASAGIDESNAFGNLILLPKDSFKTAQIVRTVLRKKHNIKNLAVIITDSRTFPLKSGVIGVALGYAGFLGIRDYRGKKDLFKKPLKITRTNIADSLATAAVLVMGEGNESMPLSKITDAPIVFKNRIKKDELWINPKDDMYRPLFQIF